MQNSDTVTSKTEKLFLLPNSGARLKRKDGRFDLTSAGLMSLIAACGGSDGGSTAPIPDPTVLDDIAQADLLTAAPVVYTSGLVGLDHNSANVVSDGNNITATSDYDTVTLSSGGNTFSLISLSTHTVAFSYGNLGGGDAVDLVFGSDHHDPDNEIIGKGDMAIIWDYNPAASTEDTPAHGGKTFNLAEDKYTAGPAPNNASAPPYLNFDTSSLSADAGFGSNGRTSFVRGYNIDNENTDLVVGNFNFDLLTIVWNIEQYYHATESQTLTVAHEKDKMLIISSTAGDIYFEKTKVFDLGDDGKADLLLMPAGGGTLRIIWDIASHKADETAFALSDGNKANFFSITATDRAFVGISSDFKSIDLDGDGSYDLYSNYRGGIIFWGSELAVKPGGAITLADTDGAVMFDANSSNADKINGLWFDVASGNAPTLERLSNNFWFVDVDQDGLRDAIYKTATDGNYSWWKLTGEKNVIADSADLSKGFGDASKGATAQTEANLKALGVIGYYRKDLNEDGKPDFIAKAANPALDDGKVYHNVWYAKGNGSLDSTARHDALVQVTAGGNLADGSDMFQLVDIA